MYEIDGTHISDILKCIMKFGGIEMLKIRPYLTFNGNCEEAIELYKKAFKTDIKDITRYSSLPHKPGMEIPEEYKGKVLQATMKFGTDFIRLADVSPDMKLNDVETERVALMIEATLSDVKHAFDVLAEEGHVGTPLGETYYSPLAGVVFDKYGVMWNLVGRDDECF